MRRTTERSIWGPLNLVGVVIVGLAVILLNRVHTGPSPSPAQDTRPVVTPIQHPRAAPVQRQGESLSQTSETKRRVIQTLKEQMAAIDNLNRQRIDALKRQLDEQTAGIGSAVADQANILKGHRKQMFENLRKDFLVGETGDAPYFLQ